MGELFGGSFGMYKAQDAKDLCGWWEGKFVCTDERKRLSSAATTTAPHLPRFFLVHVPVSATIPALTNATTPRPRLRSSHTLRQTRPRRLQCS